MNRLPLINPESAIGPTKDVLDQAKATFGSVPNMVRAMANSPVVAETYLIAVKTLGKGQLSGAQREAVALAVAQANSCDYCLSAHTVIGKMNGLNEAQVAGSRNGQTGDAKLDAIVNVARRLVASKGHLTDADLATAKSEGLTDAHLAEIVAHVAIGFYTNYFNHVAQPSIDFPVVHA